jgi:hypothetical protein
MADQSSPLQFEDVPVTIRRGPGGVIFWRSREEDLQQAKEVGARLQTERQTENTARRSQARPRGRRPRGTR